MLSLKDVSFVYTDSNVNALEDVSLDFSKGEFIGLIGGTGHGKTTLLLCLNGLIPHFVKGTFSGSVLVDGVNTRGSSVSSLAPKVGLVFQNPDDQIFSLEVRDEVGFGPRNLGFSDKEVSEKVEEALSLVGITHLADSDTSNLSAGQKQLVCIASVLAMEPAVLVLDEPTAELDFKSSEKVYHVLNSLRDQGTTVIVVEHKMNFLSEYADRIIVLNNGRVFMDDTPDKVFSSVDKLSELGISPPSVYKLRDGLKKEGVVFSFSSVDEAIKQLSARLNK
ncbi:energy-coupling factor ABC transporter ATP-binding protein [archaeon]|nr:energy-coupling factor ABC transporter ATP-binding protein [archaeon]